MNWYDHRTYARRLMLILCICIPIALFADEYAVGEIHEEVVCQEDPDYSYSLYLPNSYQPGKPHPLVLVFEPMSRATLPLEKMREAADQFGFVLACSRQTRNFNSYPVNFKAAKAMWQDVATRFEIDRERTYSAGFSGGARLASEIAIVTGNIAGHMACGAGFRDTSHANKQLSFPVALIIGNQDMNFMELTDLDRKLGFTKTTQRFFEFDAGHQWPPAEEFVKIFKWFELMAIRDGTQTSKKSFVKQMWKEDFKEAEQWAESGALVRAQRRFERMARDYEGLIKVNAAKKEADKIRKSDAYKKALQRKTRLENAEKMRQRQYVKDLREQGATLPDDLSQFPALMRPWIQEKQRHDRHILKTKNEDERLMSERLNDFTWRMCTERGALLFGRGSYREALFLNLVVTTYVPEFAFSFINAAKCYAQLGARSQAIMFLQRALDIGVNNPKAIAEDPAFVKISAYPKFQKLFQEEP